LWYKIFKQFLFHTLFFIGNFSDQVVSWLARLIIFSI